MNLADKKLLYVIAVFAVCLIGISLYGGRFLKPVSVSLGGGEYRVIADNATSTSITVANTSTTLLAANGNRHGVVFSYPNTQITSTVWITCSYVGATVGQGIQLDATSSPSFSQGGLFVLSCPWKAISNGANVPIGVFEY